MHKHLIFVFAVLCIIGSFAQESSQPTTGSEADTVNIVSTTTIATTEVTTTTPKPATTTPAPTTLEPTTTHATTTATAPPPTTTTVAPTASSTPEVGNWTVTNSTGSVCIRAIMAVQFQNLPGSITTHNLSPNASFADSKCDPPESNTQILLLKDGGFELELTFARDDLSSYVRNISLTIPNEAPLHISEKFFIVHNGKSYYCSSESDVKIDNSTIEFSHLHIQSFMHNEEDFGQAEDCEADDKMNDIVPISVAAALGGMVIIILIGYLVTRRQSRQRGYQSV